MTSFVHRRMEGHGLNIPYHEALSVDGLCDLRKVVGVEKIDEDAKDKTIIALVLVHASWNQIETEDAGLAQFLGESLALASKSSSLHDNCHHITAGLQIDRSDGSLAGLLGDDDFVGKHKQGDFPCPPERLPALAVSIQLPSSKHALIRYLTKIPPSELACFQTKCPKKSPPSCLPKIHVRAIKAIMEEIQLESQTGKRLASRKRTIQPTITPDDKGMAIRIFVAGDRSSVGKSSVCLGLLGNLVEKYGYPPETLAYIKPATQCEAPQLVQTYCESKGIACVPVGPLVYYKGFTRAFLAGETGQSSQDLLDVCAKAVDEIAKGKRIVLVDGVGFPAVGSICGTDNAQVSKACGYPTRNNYSRRPMGVLIVGGSGVGAAVDSFNLNATYFEMAHVPVIGGIFNKLSLDGFYSLENCRTQLTSYFSQNRQQKTLGRIPFGFVPKFDGIAGDNAMNHADEFIQIFGKHVDIPALIESAKRIRQLALKEDDSTSTAMDVDDCMVTTNIHDKTDTASAVAKKRKINRVGMSRQDIERMAARQGAVTS